MLASFFTFCIFYTSALLYRLTGLAPFRGADSAERLKKNKEGIVDFPAEFWKGISPEGLDLVKGMTEYDFNKRLSVAEALSHPWLAKKRLSEKRAHTQKGPNVITRATSPNSCLLRKVIETPRGLDSVRYTFEDVPNSRGTCTEQEVSSIALEDEVDFKEEDIDEMPSTCSTGLRASSCRMAIKIPPTPGPGRKKSLWELNTLAIRLRSNPVALPERPATLETEYKPEVRIRSTLLRTLRDEKIVPPLAPLFRSFRGVGKLGEGCCALVKNVGSPSFIAPKRLDENTKTVRTNLKKKI